MGKPFGFQKLILKKSRMKVLFVDKVHDVLDEMLTENGMNCTHLEDNSISKIESELSEADGIVVRSRFPLDKTFLQKANKLKFIARSGAGMENIDLDFCKENSIQVFNAPEGNRDAVGEHALAMLLMLFNKLAQGNAQVRNGQWDREGNRGIELGGKTVGIIGYGNNGQALAKKLSGFDVNILTYDKYRNDYSDAYAKESSLEDIFEKSEIVSFHIPQNKETMFMGDASFFEKFKKDIYVINLARGKIIRTSDLVKGLKSGKIKGACLDVLEYEKASFEDMFDGELPSDFQYLLDSDQVILSPHVGGWTEESYYKLSKVLGDKILSSF
jgi:D-3-phosphoglycerate dehydrogenase